MNVFTNSVYLVIQVDSGTFDAIDSGMTISHTTNNTKYLLGNETEKVHVKKVTGVNLDDYSFDYFKIEREPVDA